MHRTNGHIQSTASDSALRTQSPTTTGPDPGNAMTLAARKSIPPAFTLMVPQATHPKFARKRPASDSDQVWSYSHGTSPSYSETEQYGKKTIPAHQSETDTEPPRQKKRRLATASKHEIIRHYGRKLLTVMFSLPEIPRRLNLQAKVRATACARTVQSLASSEKYPTLRSLHADFDTMLATVVHEKELKAIISDKLEAYCVARPYWWAKCKTFGRQPQRFQVVDKVVEDVKNGKFDAADYLEYYHEGLPDPEDAMEE